jgi:hypothetical protein
MAQPQDSAASVAWPLRPTKVVRTQRSTQIRCASVSPTDAYAEDKGCAGVPADGRIPWLPSWN